MQTLLNPDWAALLASEMDKPYFKDLEKFVQHERDLGRVYPPAPLTYEALNQVPFERVKVVILGQDPYHQPGQAHGLAFSVNRGVPLPPSLKNIYKELSDDIAGFQPPPHGDLNAWAKQGVLLLNTTLTVRHNQAGSHQNKGWEVFTNRIIKMISEQKEHVVFMLWGKSAQSKRTLIDAHKHYILQAPHPSPLSAYRGFFGSRVFSKANRFLAACGSSPIDWQLPFQQLKLPM